jgi:hypothetical protein
MELFVACLTLFLVVNIPYSQENENDLLTGQEQKLSIAVVGIEGTACQEGCADKICYEFNKYGRCNFNSSEL